MSHRTPAIMIPDKGRTRLPAADETEEPIRPADSKEPTDREVRALGVFAEAWRKSHGMIHNDFISRFKPYVIDTKGWWLLRNKDYSEWGKGRDLLRKGVLGLRAALDDQDRASTVKVLTDNEHTLRFAKALKLLRQQRDVRRCVAILGPTGSGKTSTLLIGESRLGEGRTILTIRGREAWKSPREFLADWGKELGIETMAGSVAAMQTQVREALLELSDALIFVDEAHKLIGPEINMLIDWINDMAGAANSIHFVIAGIDTLWRKLSETAAEEAAQLRINRCLDEIILTPPLAEEINTMLAAGSRVASLLKPDAYASFLTHMESRAADSGSRAFVRDVCAILAGRTSLKLEDKEHKDGAKDIADSVAAKNRLRR